MNLIYIFQFYISFFNFIIQEKDKIVDDPFRSLFLYAAINSMAKMALQLWGYGINSLMKVLVGELIFQKMYLRALENSGISIDIKRQLEENERYLF